MYRFLNAPKQEENSTADAPGPSIKPELVRHRGVSFRFSRLARGSIRWPRYCRVGAIFREKSSHYQLCLMLGRRIWRVRRARSITRSIQGKCQIRRRKTTRETLVSHNGTVRPRPIQQRMRKEPSEALQTQHRVREVRWMRRARRMIDARRFIAGERHAPAAAETSAWNWFKLCFPAA